jgi:two-component system nitrate/nitrite response regulator NarL
MPEATAKKTVAVCDTQPVTAEGLKILIGSCPDLEFTAAVDSLEYGSALVRSGHPDLLIVDKGFGMQSVLDWLHDLKIYDAPPSVIVWGVSMTEAEALRLLQSGARGIVRKSADLPSLVACLRTVAQGRTWMESSVFRDAVRNEHKIRSELTPREGQVLQLVEQGFKNKEIAIELGIRPGTVKIHLKHIFEKTGVRGRYGLALTGLRDKGLVSLAS